MRGICSVLAVFLLVGCKSRSIVDAESKDDVPWLVANGTPAAVAALGRLSDGDPRAEAALQKKAGREIEPYLAAWNGVARKAPWGTELLKAALADPGRADVAAGALPRKDARVGAFTTDLESAMVRVSGGSRATAIGGVLGTVPHASDVVTRRLVDPKTRGSMCAGLALPEADPDSRAAIRAVPAEARDDEACVSLVLELAQSDDATVAWLAESAEPGLLSAMGRGHLSCARIATVWQKALTTRTSDNALAVPLLLSVERCTSALDPVLAGLLTKAPRSRACIVQALDPYGAQLPELKETCKALENGWANNESPRVASRAREAVAHGCR